MLNTVCSSRFENLGMFPEKKLAKQNLNSDFENQGTCCSRENMTCQVKSGR